MSHVELFNIPSVSMEYRLSNCARSLSPPVFSQAYQGPLRLVSLLRANFNFTTVTVLTRGHGTHSTTQKKEIRQVAQPKKNRLNL